MKELRDVIYQNVRNAVEDVLGDEVDKEQEAIVDSWAGNAFTSVLELTPRWISAGERLPDEGATVLCWREGWDSPLILRVEVDGDLQFRWVDTYDDDTDLEPTHWQPLPAAPQEEATK